MADLSSGTVLPEYLHSAFPHRLQLNRMNRDTFFDALDLSEELDDDDELSTIPLLTSDEEQQMRVESLPETLPILALRNTVLFPGVVLPITVGRDASLQLVKDAY